MEMVKSNNTQQLEVNLQKREMEIKEQNVFSISMDKPFHLSGHHLSQM